MGERGADADGYAGPSDFVAQARGDAAKIRAAAEDFEWDFSGRAETIGEVIEDTSDFVRIVC